MGNMCQRCLADDLLGIDRGDHEGTPLAPLIGTAFHAYAESMEPQVATNPVDVELRIPICEIPGYGEINGIIDRYDSQCSQILDWKVLSKKKIYGLSKTFGTMPGSFNNTRFEDTARQYYGQLMLYGYGMARQEAPVDMVTLLCVPRDATIELLETGVREFTFPYDPDYALGLIERATQLYKWASSHQDSLDELDSSPNCYYCSHQRTTQVAGIDNLF